MLSALPAQAQIQALAEALSVAGRRELDPLARRLIDALRQWRERRRRIRGPIRWIAERAGMISPTPDLVIAVARACERLEDDRRREIRRLLPEDISVALAALVASERVRDRLAAARLIGHAISEPELDALAKLLFDEAPEVAAAAGESLARSLRVDRTRTALSHARHELVAVMLDRFDELPQRDALVCAVHAARRPGGRLRALLRDETHPAHMAVRSAVRKNSIPINPSDLVHALGFRSLAPAAIDRLLTLNTATQWRDALTAAHLVRTPTRRSMLSRARDRRAPLPDSDTVHTLDEASRRSLLMWLEPIGAGASIVDELVADHSPSVRASLVVRLAHHVRPDAPVASALHALASDEREPIARSAALVLSDDGGDDGLRTLRELARSSHRSVRRYVDHARQHRDPAHLLDPATPLCNGVAVARWLEADRDNAIGTMRDALRAGDADQRIRVIVVARRLRILDEFELELLSLASHDNRRLVSATALALGWVGSATSIEALRMFVNHADDRVRANAVEALARREPLADPVDASLEAEAARQRANAIRGRLRLIEPKVRADAATRLEQMLEDDRIAHRRSALWVAQRLGSPSHAKIVARLSKSDPDDEVRERAKACGRRLLAGMRVNLAGLRTHRPNARTSMTKAGVP